MRESTGIVIAMLLVFSGFSVDNVSAQEISEFYFLAGANYNTPTGTFAENNGSIATLPTTGFSTAGVGYRLCGFIPLTPGISVFAESYVPKFSVDVDAVRVRLGLPDIMEYDAEYKIRIAGFGLRFNPIEFMGTRPYLTAGMGRYRLEIIQYISSDEFNMRFEVSNNVNFGAGILVPFGPFALDAGARYHSVDLSYEGQPLGWQATWIDMSVMLAYRFGS